MPIYGGRLQQLQVGRLATGVETHMHSQLICREGETSTPESKCNTPCLSSRSVSRNLQGRVELAGRMRALHVIGMYQAPDTCLVTVLCQQAIPSRFHKLLHLDVPLWCHCPSPIHSIGGKTRPPLES